MTSPIGSPTATLERTVRSETVADTEAVGRALAARLAGDEIILLHGDLGAGKTVLVRGLAAGMGFDAQDIQSPTFSLIREHEHGSEYGSEGEGDGSRPSGATGRLVHIDLYRLSSEEAAAMGIDECLAGPGVKAVEWPERLPEAPRGAIVVAIERGADQGRTIRIEGPRTIVGALG